METERRNAFPSKAFFDAVYTGEVPWDIGAAQPDLMEVILKYPPQGVVLDLGCGTGDLTIALAGKGIRAIGIDFVPAAIDEARKRSKRLSEVERSRVEFRVGDALALQDFKGQIESVADTGFYHLFDAATRSRLVREVSEVIPTGGRYYLLGFAVSLPAEDVPRRVTEEEVGRLFSREAGWVVRECRDAGFSTNGFDRIPAIALCAERV